MERKKVRVHTCEQAKEQGLKIEGYIDGKCRCRKFVTLEKAAQLVEDGVANPVVLSWRTEDVDRICPVCDGQDKFKKRCRVCNETGKVTEPKVFLETGEDIYIRPFLKTPRTATIEAKHIEYAYVKADKDAKKRIDIYHTSDQMNFAKLGASLVDAKTKEVLFEGTPEPKDDLKTGTGRKHDWGRTV